MQNNIYILFSCDEWKTKNSMRLITATSTEKRLRTIITKLIYSQKMESRCFDLDKYPINCLNNYLVYGHIEIIKDREV